MPISWCLEVHFRRERQIKCFPDLSRGEPWNFQRGVARRFAVRRTNRTSSKSGEIRVVSAVSLLLLRQWKWTGCVHQGLFKNYATSRSAMPVSSQILYWTDAKHTPKIMRVGFEKHNPLPFAFSVFFFCLCIKYSSHPLLQGLSPSFGSFANALHGLGQAQFV